MPQAEEETDQTEGVERGFIIIDRADCLKCAHFAPGIATKAMPCTAEDGNPHCPASQMQVVVGTNVTKAGNAIADAIAGGDFQKSARLLGKLESYHAVIQQQVMRQVRSRMLTTAIASEMEPIPEDTTEGAPAAPESAAPESDASDVQAEAPASPQTELTPPAQVVTKADAADWED